MKAERYADALQCYTKAIELDGSNAVFYCNRFAVTQLLLSNYYYYFILLCLELLLIQNWIITMLH